MAFDLTAALSSRSSEIKNNANVSNKYKLALKALWNGDNEQALEIVTTAIANEPECDDRFNCYRLWIELAAGSVDIESLQVLAKHLMLRGQAEPEFSHVYGALRGLVHFEMDEFSAAQLISNSCSGSNVTAFALELEQMVTNRLVDQDDYPALCRAATPLVDYFHIASLAKGLLQAGETESLQQVLDYSSEIWPNSPIKSEFALHVAFDNSDFKKVSEIARDLVKQNPENSTFKYYSGYALMKLNKFEDALDVLTKASSQLGEVDGEILSMISECHASLGALNKAEAFIKRSISILKDQGFPYTKERLALLEIEESLRGDQIDPAIELPQMTRMWLVNLSPRRFSEIRNGDMSAVENILRPMGNEPKAGDFCFFASTQNSENGSVQWKIGAIYTIDTEPMWHPTEGHQNALTLVSRPESCIPVDVCLVEEDVNNEDFHTEHPFSFGVYELEMGALDVITEATRLKNEGSESDVVSLTGKVG